MKPSDYFEKLARIESKAMLALGYIPQRSKYRSYVKQLNAREITAIKFVQLENRLKKFYQVEEL